MRRTTFVPVLALSGVLLGSLGGCYTTGAAAAPRTSGPSESDIFTSTDAKAVYKAMVDDCLSKPWADDWFSSNDENPVIVVGTVAADARERIKTNVITREIERELINSRRVRVIADNEQVEQLVAARTAQRDFTRTDDWARMANQMGANFIMIGEIEAQRYNNNAGGRTTTFDIFIELIDLETAEKVWIESYQVKKRAAS